MFATDISTTSAEATFRVKVPSAAAVETSVANNSPSQDSDHQDHLFQSRYVTPGFKPLSDNKDVRKTKTNILCQSSNKIQIRKEDKKIELSGHFVHFKV